MAGGWGDEDRLPAGICDRHPYRLADVSLGLSLPQPQQLPDLAAFSFSPIAGAPVELKLDPAPGARAERRPPLVQPALDADAPWVTAPLGSARPRVGELPQE